MRGIVRWMNELGIYTKHCCDGHGKRTPYVGLLQLPTDRQMNMLQFCVPEGLRLKWRGRQILMEAEAQSGATLLLEFAERLHSLVENPELLRQYEAQKFKAYDLMDLLSIPGASGREDQVRRYLTRKLRLFADDIYKDDYGNLLATTYCGEGPTVLLSSHMDVCRELDPDRKILEDGTWLSSTSGILGADDRAGIAVALYLLRRIRRTNFRGTLKLAFTVEEEIGLIGASNIDPDFMEDVDAAIVIDRRGKRDVVVCRGDIPFCDPSYGRLFEQAGELAGIPGWKMTCGGSSDALVFAEKFRIPAVNLSVGYENEHTSAERLDFAAAYDTARLIETVLDQQLIEKWKGLC
jgi:hypothetical protein